MQRKFRLRRRTDFAKVYRLGKSAANNQFVIYVRSSIEANPFRLGISVSRKVAGAVTRNRIRRAIKEIIRHYSVNIVTGVDLVLIVRKPAVNLDYNEMKSSLKHVLKRAGVWKTGDS
jgi:ribonuclease P protein component